MRDLRNGPAASQALGAGGRSYRAEGPEGSRSRSLTRWFAEGKAMSKAKLTAIAEYTRSAPRKARKARAVYDTPEGRAGSYGRHWMGTAGV